MSNTNPTKKKTSKMERIVKTVAIIMVTLMIASAILGLISSFM